MKYFLMCFILLFLVSSYFVYSAECSESGGCPTYSVGDKSYFEYGYFSFQRGGARSGGGISTLEGALYLGAYESEYHANSVYDANPPGYRSLKDDECDLHYCSCGGVMVSQYDTNNTENPDYGEGDLYCDPVLKYWRNPEDLTGAIPEFSLTTAIITLIASMIIILIILKK